MTAEDKAEPSNRLPIFDEYNFSNLLHSKGRQSGVLVCGNQLAKGPSLDDFTSAIIHSMYILRLPSYLAHRGRAKITEVARTVTDSHVYLL